MSINEFTFIWSLARNALLFADLAFKLELADIHNYSRFSRGLEETTKQAFYCCEQELLFWECIGVVTVHRCEGSQVWSEKCVTSQVWRFTVCDGSQCVTVHSVWRQVWRFTVCDVRCEVCQVWRFTVCDVTVCDVTGVTVHRYEAKSVSRNPCRNTDKDLSIRLSLPDSTDIFQKRSPHHHVMPLAWISLTLSRHPSLSSIGSGSFSMLHSVSAQSRCR